MTEENALGLDDLATGTCCYLRTADGRFLAFTRRAGFHLAGTHARTWFEIAYTGDQRALLRCAHGPYLCACPDGRFTPAQSASGWESFEVRSNEEGGLTLRSIHGGYVAAAEDRDGITLRESPPSRCERIDLVAAFSTSEYERALCASRPAEKVVWAFWHAGSRALCPFYALNLRTWSHILGPDWRIHVLNAVEGDEHNVRRFVDANLLPASFDRLAPIVQSDAVRLALLSAYGGVWMDVGILLLKGLDEICWNRMEGPDSRTLLGGFFTSGWGSDHLERRDVFESWFIAARANNAFVECWRQAFVEYWGDRTRSSDIAAHRLFESIELSNFQRYGVDLRDYLTPHVMFRWVLESNPHMRSIWKHNMHLCDSWDDPFLLPRLIGWQGEDVRRALIGPCREDLRQALSGTSLLKFTGGMTAGLSDLREEALLDPRSTLGRLYQQVFRTRT